MKSAISFTRTPLGCRPRPEARQALGLQAGERKREKVWVLNGPGWRPSSLSLTTLLQVDLLTPPRHWAWPHATLHHAFCVQYRTGSAGSNLGTRQRSGCRQVRAFPWSHLRQRHGGFCTAWAKRQVHCLPTLKAFHCSPRLSQHLHSCLTNCGMPRDIQHHHGTRGIPCSIKPSAAHDQCIETSLVQYRKWH